MASSRVSPWLTHPGKLGHSTTHPPLSSLNRITCRIAAPPSGFQVSPPQIVTLSEQRRDDALPPHLLRAGGVAHHGGGAGEQQVHELTAAVHAGLLIDRLGLTAHRLLAHVAAA